VHIRVLLHLFIWVSAFFDGLVDVLGLPGGIFNRLAQIAVLVLLVHTINQPKRRLPFALHVAGLSVVAVVSGYYLNGFSASAVFAYLRQLILVPYAYFLIVYNERDLRLLEMVSRAVVYLIAAQIPAFLIKLALVGTTEDYIGTLAAREGSVTTIFVLIPSAFFFARYLWTQENRNLLFISVFLLLSQINEKRAVLLYAPILFLSMYLLHLYCNRTRMNRAFVQSAAVLAVLPIFVISIAVINPTLNPEGRVGGRFDPAFIKQYVLKYNFGQGEEGSIWDYSRLEAIPYIGGYIWSRDGLTRLVGEGAGKLTAANKDVPPETDPVQYYYQIRYGGRVGIIWVLLQTGFLGVGLYSLLWIRFGRRILGCEIKSFHQVAVLGILIVVLFDVYSYSMVTFRFFSIHGLLYSYAALYLSGALQHLRYGLFLSPKRTL
jgi:hypothetical protein